MSINYHIRIGTCEYKKHCQCDLGCLLHSEWLTKFWSGLRTVKNEKQILVIHSCKLNGIYVYMLSIHWRITTYPVRFLIGRGIGRHAIAKLISSLRLLCECLSTTQKFWSFIFIELSHKWIYCQGFYGNDNGNDSVLGSPLYLKAQVSGCVI